MEDTQFISMNQSTARTQQDTKPNHFLMEAPAACGRWDRCEEIKATLAALTCQVLQLAVTRSRKDSGFPPSYVTTSDKQQESNSQAKFHHISKLLLSSRCRSNDTTFSVHLVKSLLCFLWFLFFFFVFLLGSPMSIFHERKS